MVVGSPDLKAFLVATPFFGGLSDASLDLLISMLVERRFDVGATVVAEGEPGRSMYVVHSGELVVSAARNGLQSDARYEHYGRPTAPGDDEGIVVVDMRLSAV